MTDPSDPWQTILKPTDMTRISASRAVHPLDFFRGRNGHGEYLFWLEIPALSDSHSSGPQLPHFSGMRVSRESGSSGSWRLQLTLLDSESFPIFRALCADLLNATAHLQSGNSEAGMHTVVGRLDRWYRLFLQARDRLLTAEQQIGLVGELLFLDDFVMSHLPVSIAIGSWQGPRGAAQDFALPGAAAEVKSGDRPYVRIASEFQLDILNGPVVLVNQIVREATTLDDSHTLADVVRQVRSRVSEFGSAAAMDRLVLLLCEAGYSEREEYDRVFLVLSDRSFYWITDQFPRIDTTHTGELIINVQYQLRLSQCDAWRIPESEAVQRLIKPS